MKNNCNCAHNVAPKVLKFTKVRNVKSPERGTSKSAGIDFFVPNEIDSALTTVTPRSDVLIPSGIVANIPEGYMLMAAEKSGVATSKGACRRAGRKPKQDAFECPTVVGAKIVDEDYQGEIHIHIINAGNQPLEIKPGFKIAQFILVPVEYCTLEEVSSKEALFEVESERGDGALGSTGSM